jgi:hypothetical protein
MSGKSGETVLLVLASELNASRRTPDGKTPFA